MRQAWPVLVIAGCASSPQGASLPDGPPIVQSELDLLFVVSDVPNIASAQQALRDAMPSFVATLAGETDVHVGVVSSDMGTSTPGGQGPQIGSGRGSCLATGKDGALRHGLATVAGDFLTQLDATTMGQMVMLGADGCGFAQGIHAAARGLDGRNPGFRRPEARLAIVFVTEDDDCSPSSPSFYAPVDELACFSSGVTCNEPGDTAGTKTGCHAVAGSEMFDDLATIVPTFAPDRAVAAAIIGASTPANLIVVTPAGSPPQVRLDNSCTWSTMDGTSTSEPSIRIEDFVDRFPHHLVRSICSADLAPQLTAIAQAIVDARR